MIYFNLALDLIKFIVKLLLTKCNNLRSPLRISFNKQSFKKSIIIGTGPSLLKDVHEINSYKKDECDFFGVNFFANTETFIQLKPNFYFLADKLFWSKDLNKNISSIANETVALLKKYSWPGNVRELENMIERATLMCQEDTLLPSHLFFDEEEIQSKKSSRPPTQFKGTIYAMEKELIVQTLEDVNGNKTKAAANLGISIRTLRNKLAYYKNQPEN